jgi:hypothetical protein
VSHSSSTGAVAPVLTATNELRAKSQEPLLEVATTKELALTKGHAPEVLRGGAASEGVVSRQLAEGGPVLGSLC